MVFLQYYQYLGCSVQKSPLIYTFEYTLNNLSIKLIYIHFVQIIVEYSFFYLIVSILYLFCLVIYCKFGVIRTKILISLSNNSLIVAVPGAQVIITLVKVTNKYDCQFNEQVDTKSRIYLNIMFQCLEGIQLTHYIYSVFF